MRDAPGSEVIGTQSSPLLAANPNMLRHDQDDDNHTFLMIFLIVILVISLHVAEVSDVRLPGQLSDSSAPQ